MNPKQKISRRQVLAVASGVAVAMIVPRHVLGQGQTPPSETLNVAGVGIGGMGSNDVREISKDASVVALCDVDGRALAGNAQYHPKATHYRETLLWDGPNLRFTNSEAANQLINPAYRQGWSLG